MRYTECMSAQYVMLAKIFRKRLRALLGELVARELDLVPKEAAEEVSVTWHEPESWTQARQMAIDGKVDNGAEAAKILAMLETMK